MGESDTNGAGRGQVCRGYGSLPMEREVMGREEEKQPPVQGSLKFGAGQFSFSGALKALGQSLGCNLKAKTNEVVLSQLRAEGNLSPRATLGGGLPGGHSAHVPARKRQVSLGRGRWSPGQRAKETKVRPQEDSL